MLAELVNRTAERYERYRLRPVDQFPSLTQLTENVVIGSFSWLGMSTHTRWIQAATAIPLGGMLATPGDIARDYLRIKFPKRSRVTTDQYHRIMVHRHHPLYAHPVELDDAVYIDLKAAYWSIMRVVGWNVDYNPGRWLGQGESLADFPYAGHKLARNCLATAGLIGSGKMWIGAESRLITTKRYNALANYSLWSLLHDVLNSIAADVVSAGAVYVHTDGYIVAANKADAVMDAIAQWNLTAGIKYTGPAKVFTAGTYSIGSRPSGRKVYATRATRAIALHVNRNWLRRKFTALTQEELCPA